MSVDMRNVDMFSKNRIAKLTSIIGFSLIALLSVQARFLAPSNGYELSMYIVYPSFFWVCAIFTLIFVSISFMYVSVYRRKNLSLLLFIALILTVTVIISLPIMRNYYLLGRGDVLTQLGHIKHILQSNQIPHRDIYPFTHVLASSTSLITSIPSNKVLLAIPVLMYLLFSSVILSLSRRITNQNIQQPLIIVIATMPIYGHNIILSVPHTIGFFYSSTVFLAVVIMMNNTKKSTILVFLVAGISGVLFHPMDGFFLILVCFSLIGAANSRHIGHRSIRNSGLFLILAVWIAYTIWYFSQPGVLGLVARELKFLLQGSGSANAATYTGLLGELPITYLLEVAFWRFGMLAIVTGSVFFSLIFLYKSSKYKNMPKYLIIFSVLFSLYILITLGSNFVIISDMSRISKYDFLLGAIVIGLAYGNLMHTTNKRKVAFSIFCVFIIITSIIGVLTVYNGPSIKNPGQQVTQEEISGYRWIFSHGSLENIDIDGFGLFSERYHYAIYGERNSKLIQPFEEISPPPHFGYDENSTIDAVYPGKEYLLVSGITRKYYKGLYPKQKDYWRYTPKDVNQLSNDRSAEPIYTTGNNTIYLV